MCELFFVLLVIERCNFNVDIVFLVDFLGSIFCENYEKVKIFVLNFVVSFNIFLGGFCVVVVFYSIGVIIVIKFDDFISVDLFERVVKFLKYECGFIRIDFVF